MEVTSAPLHKAEVSWRGLLLTALLLTFWNFATTAELTVEAVPPHVGEGDNVYFLAQNVPSKHTVFYWLRGTKFDMSNNIIQLITLPRSKIEKGPLYSKRETIYANGSLLFKNVTKKDAGVYMLHLDDKLATLQLYVEGKLHHPVLLAYEYPNKDGKTVILTCYALNDRVSISWLFNDKPLKITENIVLTNNSLTIKNATVEDSGQYNCEVSREFSFKTSNSYNLKIIEPVTKPSIEATNTTVEDQTSVILKCLTKNTRISIHWLFKGKSLVITNRMNLSENKTILEINPARSKDSGYYQCEVSNEISSMKSDPIQLDVIDPVTTPSIEATKTTVKELDSVSLTCYSNDTGISIRWLFKGKILRITNRMRLSSNNSTLQIYSVKREDSGNYQCEVSNRVSSKSSDPIQLDILDPVTTPSIEATKTTVKELDSVSLTCYSNDTGISIRWLFKGQSLRITNRMRLSLNNSTLQIDSVKREDSGDYQCEVSNKINSKRSDPIQLKILEPVTLPSIQVTNTTVKNLISVFLNCFSNSTGISVNWLYKGQSLRITNRMRLSPNNSTLQIESVKIEDSGDYQCEISNQVSSKRSDPIQLNIIRERAKPKKHRPSLRGIIGIVAQCLMGLIAVIFVLFFLWRSRRGREPQIENDIKQVDNEPSNLNEPINLNETSKAASNVKPQKEKKPKGKK